MMAVASPKKEPFTRLSEADAEKVRQQELQLVGRIQALLDAAKFENDSLKRRLRVEGVETSIAKAAPAHSHGEEPTALSQVLEERRAGTTSRWDRVARYGAT